MLADMIRASALGRGVLGSLPTAALSSSDVFV